jgi:hypothetical protein
LASLGLFAVWFCKPAVSGSTPEGGSFTRTWRPGVTRQSTCFKFSVEYAPWFADVMRHMGASAISNVWSACAGLALLILCGCQMSRPASVHVTPRPITSPAEQCELASAKDLFYRRRGFAGPSGRRVRRGGDAACGVAVGELLRESRARTQRDGPGGQGGGRGAG